MPRVKPLIDTPELRSERRRAAAKIAIRCGMVRAGMTQKELAKKVGICAASMSNYMNGRRNWDYDDLAEIARILHFTAEEWVEIAVIK